MNGKIWAKVLLICVVLLTVGLIPISSQQGPRDYSPWADLNDDGDIDIRDVSEVARRFGTHGTPFVTKAGLNYTSDWIDITDKQGQYITITHNLNSTDIIVDIQGKTTDDGGVHQIHLGGIGYISGWSRTYGGADLDKAFSMIQTSDGGYAIAGYTYSYGAGDSDFWLVKTNSVGDVEWNKTYGGPSTDDAHCVFQTSDGGYVIVGMTGSFGAGNADFWLVKTDSVGNMEWTRTYGGAPDNGRIGYDSASSVVQTGDGGYAIAGMTSSFGAGGYDFWLVKTDSSGNMQWNQTYGGPSDEYAQSVVQTGDGGYAIAGMTSSFGAGSADFWLVKTDSSGNMQWNQTYGRASSEVARSVVQTNDGGYALTGHGIGYDSWLVKTDSSGNMQWNQTYGGASFDTSYSLVQTSDGGYILAGRTGSFGAGNQDFWLVKTNSTGNMQWKRTYGGTEWDEAWSVVQTGDGGFAIAGYTGSFGTGGDFWLVKTDSNGNILFESGLAWTDSTANTITLYKGATDAYWNYVRVRVWMTKEKP